MWATMFFLFLLLVPWIFIAASGLSLIVGSGGYYLVSVPGLLTAVPSFVADYSLQGTEASVVAARGL